MFLKYPKTVKLMITECLNENGTSVVTNEEDRKRFYGVKGKLEEIDIEPKTEIFTRYGKCKIIKMNGRWYLYVMPSNILVRNADEKRYREGYCSFVSNDADKTKLLELYLKRIDQMKEEYLENKKARFNKRISECIDTIYSNLKVIDAITFYDRECSAIKCSHLSDENIKGFKNIMELVERLEKIPQSPEKKEC